MKHNQFSPLKSYSSANQWYQNCSVTRLIAFSSLHIQRWAFDVEILKIAEMLSLPIAEVAVNWKEIDGSKLDPASASIQMFKDIMLLWLRYKLRLWRVVEETLEKKNL